MLAVAVAVAAVGLTRPRGVVRLDTTTDRVPAAVAAAAPASPARRLWQTTRGGRVLVVGGTLLTSGGGVLAALDLHDGSVRWQLRRTDATARSAVTDGHTVVVVYDLADRVHPVSGRVDTSVVMALDVATGRLRWTSAVLGETGQDPSLALAGDVVAVHDADGVSGLDAATGQRRWSTPAAAGCHVSHRGGGGAGAGTLVVAAGTVVLAEDCLSGGRLVGLRASDGTSRWTADQAGAARWLMVAGGHALATVEVRPAAGLARDDLVALDPATGRAAWTAAGDGWLPAVTAGDTVLGSDGTALVGLDSADGRQVWRRAWADLDGAGHPGVASLPVVADGGLAYAALAGPKATGSGATGSGATGSGATGSGGLVTLDVGTGAVRSTVTVTARRRVPVRQQYPLAVPVAPVAAGGGTVVVSGQPLRRLGLSVYAEGAPASS